MFVLFFSTLCVLSIEILSRNNVRGTSCTKGLKKKRQYLYSYYTCARFELEMNKRRWNEDRHSCNILNLHINAWQDLMHLLLMFGQALWCPRIWHKMCLDEQDTTIGMNLIITMDYKFSQGNCFPLIISTKFITITVSSYRIWTSLNIFLAGLPDNTKTESFSVFQFI